jgi:hypothetical protein
VRGEEKESGRGGGREGVQVRARTGRPAIAHGHQCAVAMGWGRRARSAGATCGVRGPSPLDRRLAGVHARRESWAGPVLASGPNGWPRPTKPKKWIFIFVLNFHFLNIAPIQI